MQFAVKLNSVFGLSSTASRTTGRFCDFAPDHSFLELVVREWDVLKAFGLAQTAMGHAPDSIMTLMEARIKGEETVERFSRVEVSTPPLSAYYTKQGVADLLRRVQDHYQMVSSTLQCFSTGGTFLRDIVSFHAPAVSSSANRFCMLWLVFVAPHRMP